VILSRRMSLMVTRERFQPIIDQLVYALFGPADTMKEFLRRSSNFASNRFAGW
jgi:hypothetical protein